MTKLEDISYYLHIPPPDPETDYFGDNYVEWHIYGWRRDGTSGLSRNDTSFLKFKMDSDQVSEFLKEWDDLKWEVYSLLLKNKESLRENTSEEVESGLPVLAWRLTEGIEGLPSFSRQEFDADVVWDFFLIRA